MKVSYAFDEWRWCGAPTMAQIAKEVATKHGLTVAELKAWSRRRYIVRPRQEAMWRMRQETSQSFPAIARFFGGMDHTTVLHGVRAHAARLAKIPLRRCKMSPAPGQPRSGLASLHD